jgi:predicted nuclease with TOPRIM domain
MSIQSVGEFFLHDCSGLRRIIIGDDQRCLIAAAERSGLAGIMEIVPAHPLAKELRDQLVSVDIRVSAATNDMLQAKEELAGAQGLLSAKAAEWAAGRAEVEKLRGKVEERDAKIKDLDESRVAIYNAFMPLRKGVLAIRDELRHSAFVEATGLGEAALTMELRGLIRATHEPKNADGRSYPVDGPDGMVVTL